MLELFYACAVTKYQNFSWILHFWYSLFQFLQVFANSCELNPTLAILPLLCIFNELAWWRQSMLHSSTLLIYLSLISQHTVAIFYLHGPIPCIKILIKDNTVTVFISRVHMVLLCKTEFQNFFMNRLWAFQWIFFNKLYYFCFVPLSRYSVPLSVSVKWLTKLLIVAWSKLFWKSSARVSFIQVYKNVPQILCFCLWNYLKHSQPQNLLYSFLTDIKQVSLCLRQYWFKVWSKKNIQVKVWHNLQCITACCCSYPTVLL